VATVFVYGTLRSDERVATLLDAYAWDGAAVLDGLHMVAGRYPTLVPGGSVEGQLLETSQIGRLHDYEGVDRGLYVRVSIPVDDGGSAEVYVGDPRRLDIDDPWPGTDPFGSRVEGYLATHDVVLRRA
jgi:gamma-glutamylcyclotransferase (GGCT)/AIG2-like uncharacterized protein YtfP